MHLCASGRLSALPAAIEVVAYRIATEALTNVVRHSGARSVVLDHLVVRSGISALLSSLPAFAVVGAATDGAETVKECASPSSAERRGDDRGVDDDHS